VLEAMYGGKWGAKNLGNTEAGDAARFKGRGFTQLTGRDNYVAASKALGIDFVGHPELASDPANAAAIAKWFWSSKAGLADAGKRGDVAGATRLLNGGSTGLTARQELYSKDRAAIGAPLSSPVVAATYTMPRLSALPTITVPAPAIAPPTATANIPFKLNSPAPIDVRVSTDQLANQDMSDRTLAHIVTGGVSG
jgi:Chitinase class I